MIQPEDVVIKVEPPDYTADFRFTNGEPEDGMSPSFSEFPVDVEFPGDVVGSKYRCLVCNKGYNLKAKLDFHTIYSECGGNAPPVYLCKLCKQHFENRRGLREHVFVHTGAENVAENYVISCLNCHRSFNRPTELAVHMQSCTSMKSMPLQNIQARPQLIIAPPQNIINPALSQPVLFFLQQGGTLATAVPAPSGQQPSLALRHTCKECGKVFRMPQHLKLHQKVHLRGGLRKTAAPAVIAVRNIDDKDVGTEMAATNIATAAAGKSAASDAAEGSSDKPVLSEEQDVDVELEVAAPKGDVATNEGANVDQVSSTTAEMPLQAENLQLSLPNPAVVLSSVETIDENAKGVTDLERHQVVHSRYKRIAPKGGVPITPFHNIETENAQQGASWVKADVPYKFPCDFCDKKFKCTSHLRDHVVALHTKDYSQFRHVCELCEKRFRVPKELFKHLKIHHNAYAQLQCKLCILRFVKQDSLKHHIAEKHGQCLITEPISNPSGGMADDNFASSLCEIVCTTEETSEKLNLPESDKQNLAVQLTNPDVIRTSGLDHQQAIHGRYVSIAPKITGTSAPQIDGIETENASQLAGRDANSTDPYKFPCQYCQKKFKYTSHLRDHVIALHTKDFSQFRHVCQVCSKRFRVPKELVAHLMRYHGIYMNLHTAADQSAKAEKLLDRYCETLPAIEGISNQLYVPESSNVNLADQDKFTCQFCGKKFNYTHHLRDHVSSKHTKDFSYFRHKCKLCNERFRVPSRLLAHLKLHHFCCVHCSEEFANADELTKHIAEMHNGDEGDNITGLLGTEPEVMDESPENLSATTSDNIADSESIQSVETDTPDDNILNEMLSQDEDMSDVPDRSGNEAGDPSYEQLDQYSPYIYPCQYCGKKFKYTHHLRDHVSSKHTKDFSYFRHMCELCEKRFRVPSVLYVHLLRHHNVIPELQCHKCSLKFVKQNSLDKHVDDVHQLVGATKVAVMHTCKICKKKFISEIGLSCHINHHHRDAASTKKYACWFCKKTFLSLYFVKLHVQRVHEGQERAHMCEHCPKVFSKRNELVEHIRLHHDDASPYNCKLCDKSYAILGSLTKHMIGTHGMGNIETYSCEVCEKTFTSKHSMDVHIRRYHMDDLSSNWYPCPRCGRQFKLKHHRNEHVRRVHLKVKPHKCNKCQKAFFRPYQLFEHLKVHRQGNKPLHCTLCNKMFQSVASLDEHYTNTHENEMGNLLADQDLVDAKDDGEIVGCQFCGKECTGRKSLCCHIERFHCDRSPSEKHVCPYCQRQFRNKWDVKMHIKRLHLLEKEYKCDKCPKAFVTLYELRQHQVIHTDAIRLVCAICNRKFKTVEILKRHEKLHRGDTSHLRHMCEFCGIRRRTPRELQIHIRCHTREKPFQCECCGKAFATLSSLQSHKVTHTKERNYKCTLCDKRYGRVGCLKKHFQTHHKEVDYDKMEWSAPRVQRQPTATADLEPGNSTDVGQWTDKVPS